MKVGSKRAIEGMVISVIPQITIFAVKNQSYGPAQDLGWDFG